MDGLILAAVATGLFFLPLIVNEYAQNAKFGLPIGIAAASLAIAAAVLIGGDFGFKLGMTALTPLIVFIAVYFLSK